MLIYHKGGGETPLILWPVTGSLYQFRITRVGEDEYGALVE
jgi:hypothetical protein